MVATGYTDLLIEAREEAFTRMLGQAEAQGANAVVGIKITGTAVADGASEILCYGTAVIVE